MAANIEISGVCLLGNVSMPQQEIDNGQRRAGFKFPVQKMLKGVFDIEQLKTLHFTVQGIDLRDQRTVRR
jgi:hypothetical protein